MIVSLVGLVWLDEYLAGKPIPFQFGTATLPPGVITFVTMSVAGFMGCRELARMLREKEIAASTRVTCAAGCLGVLVSALAPSGRGAPIGVAIASTGAIVVLLVALRFYSRGKNPHGVIAAAGGAVLAYVYLGLMFGFLLLIRREHSAWVLLWIMAMTKSADIGAYFTGRALGRHKLIPWLSPGKTWEGLIGGVVFAAGAGVLGAWLLRSNGIEKIPTWWASALFGGFSAVVGQGGDLVMSLFKRDAGRKDSGHSLPGFGGMLDVLDSLLLVTPVAYWWLVVAT